MPGFTVRGTQPPYGVGMKILGRFVALLVCTTLVHGASSFVPAQARSAGSLASSAGVLYGTCAEHRYRYSFAVEPGYDYSLSIDVSVYGPDGIKTDADFDYDISTSGSGGLLFCGSEMAGRYRLEAEVEACDYDYDCYAFDLNPTSFSMRKPHTNTVLVASPARPRFNQAVAFKIRAKDERPRGYFATDGASVVLEAFSKGRWVRVRGSKSYAWDGVAVVRYRWNIRGALRLRAKTLASSELSMSTSRAITIRTR